MRRAIYVRLFDLHCDTPSYCLQQQASIRQHDGGVDLARGATFRPWSQCFAAFLPDELAAEEAWRLCDSLLDTVHRWNREPDFRLCRCGADFITPFDGCSALLTVENAGVLGTDLSVLDTLFQRGVRVAGLTWNGDNSWGSGCMGSTHGLTAAGCLALRRLEDLGVTLDVSHLGAVALRDVARLARRPYIATHSNAAAVCPHPRNLSDDDFCRIRDSGGVVGLNLYAPHLGCTDVLTAFQRHLEHFLSLDGEHCVCIGSDLDGMDSPAAWEGMRILENLWNFLQGAGYPANLLEDIFYNNAHDFFCRVLT